MKLQVIAEKLGCRLEGDGGVEITGVTGIDHAVEGQVTFLANRKYSPMLKTTGASAVFIEDGVVVERAAGHGPLVALRTSNPYLAFARAIELFYEEPTYVCGIHPTAVIAKSAKIGARAHIGPFCFVDEDVTIGEDAVLHSSVTIYRGVKIGAKFFAHAHAVVREFCEIGNRVILQNGVIIGGDGLGFAKQADGRWYKIVQSGPTVLEDDVEIQANSTVDRATVGETRIGRGTKIDDLVLIGHASQVGENTMICGQVGLAGSTKLGNNCIMAGQSATVGHLTIGDGAVVTAQSGIPGDVPARAMRSGSPAIENRQWLRMVAVQNRLPELLKRVQALEEEKKK